MALHDLLSFFFLFCISLPFHLRRLHTYFLDSPPFTLSLSFFPFHQENRRRVENSIIRGTDATQLTWQTGGRQPPKLQHTSVIGRIESSEHLSANSFGPPTREKTGAVDECRSPCLTSLRALRRSARQCRVCLSLCLWLPSSVIAVVCCFLGIRRNWIQPCSHAGCGFDGTTPPRRQIRFATT